MLDKAVLERLRAMTERNVVRIRAAGEFRGSGFLVSRDTVLTCAHVVAGCEERSLTAEVDGGVLAVEVVALAPPARGEGAVHGFPDLAALRLSEPVGHTDGVWLDERAPTQSERVSVHGFSGRTLEPGIQPDTLDLRVAGHSGRFVRLHGDQVVQGFSGGPVLSTGTGRVCGILKASRNEKNESGGWLIPVEAVEECTPGLLERNAAAHRPGTDWFDVARGRTELQEALFDAADDGAAPPATPSRMLAQGAMPFVDRPELEQLETWCHEPSDQVLRLLHAPGGAGKTRLSAEVCRRVRERGWIAGFAERDAFRDPSGRGRWLESLTTALTAGFPVLVVFDYAQARQDDVGALLKHVHRRRTRDLTLRVLLLARSEEPLWRSLREALEDLGIDDWALRSAVSRRLPDTIATTGPEDLAARAFTEFARQLGCPWLPVPVSLGGRAGRQDSLLGVLASALDAVLTLRHGGTWAEGEDPLERICRHETRGWHALLEDRLGRDGPLAGRGGPLMTQGLLLVPTLATGRDREELTALLGRTREAAFPGQPALNMSSVHACLRMLYPSGPGGVAPLEPDRVGEILIRRVLGEEESSGPGGRGYLRAVLDGGGLEGDRRADALLETLDALARSRGCTSVGRVVEHPAHELLDRALAEAVRANPRELLPALAVTGGRVPHAEPLAGVMRPVLETCDTSLLLEVEKHLPGHPSGLSEVSALVLTRLLREPDASDGEADRLLRIRRLRACSLRHEETGRRTEAIEAAARAVELSRDLRRRSASYTADHAMALSHLSLLKHREGQNGPALELSVEAVALHRELLDAAGGDRRRRLLDTASALSTLALLRLSDHQVNGAAADAAEGVTWCDQAAPGGRQEDVLLECLELLAVCRQRTGLTEDALATGAEALELLRGLAERRPGHYRTRLPESLHRHGLHLVWAGRPDEAYGAVREGVLLRAALPPTPARARDQRNALELLLRLSGDVDTAAQERSSWVGMLSATDG
ncbi:trypsin-like peptidase domain-containing protein [Streptomyces sp. NPDC127038]|uniref:trypsin-like peptidase domain-containing protein n=1 Tax=Streptomyces sp. NPDC127038 TaxID=3347114 RepID=UPI0036496E57